MAVDMTQLLAAIRYERGIEVSQILRDVVARLREESAVVGGVLQEAVQTDDGLCAMLNVVDIRCGEKARITEDRGRNARGCKLDPRGLARIGPCIEDAIHAGVDLLVINRFGRAESEGRGLLPYVSDAIGVGIPVLTAVREPYVAPWQAFHGGLATDLPPSVESVMAWFRGVRRRTMMQPVESEGVHQPK
jgi:nucleoside-triphosphatase THEP1